MRLASRRCAQARHAAPPPDLSSAAVRTTPQDSQAPVRILIVSDVRFVREGLSEILPRQAPIDVVATAGDHDQALEHAGFLHPDAILLDTSLPDGLGIVARLNAAAPDIPVIALAIVDAEQAVLPWIEAGIAGYVPRSSSISDLIDTVTRVAHGELTCSAKVVAAMMRRMHQLATALRQERSTAADVRLTPREREIAQLVADGLSNKLIARRLHIEVATAKCHVHNILDKLKIHRRSDLARRVRP
jgi:two-component system nitrate/nitrite response regulator NarL